VKQAVIKSNVVRKRIKIKRIKAHGSRDSQQDRCLCRFHQTQIPIRGCLHCWAYAARADGRDGTAVCVHPTCRGAARPTCRAGACACCICVSVRICVNFFKDENVSSLKG
jgi:hypothetical protein